MGPSVGVVGPSVGVVVGVMVGLLWVCGTTAWQGGRERRASTNAATWASTSMDLVEKEKIRTRESVFCTG